MRKFDIKGRVGLDTTQFDRAIKRTRKGIRSFATGAIGQFGALAGITGLGAMATSAIRLGSRISDLATQLNIGTEELQTLQFAAQEAGVSSSTLERALRNVQLRTEEAINGNKSYAAAFERLGIDINKFRELPVEKKLEAIAIAQANAKDQTQAYNDVARILGERAGPELQEVLQRLATEGFDKVKKSAEEAGQVMDDDTIKRLDAASDEIDRVKKALTIFAGEMLADVIPVLKALWHWTDKALIKPFQSFTADKWGDAMTGRFERAAAERSLERRGVDVPKMGFKRQEMIREEQERLKKQAEFFKANPISTLRMRGLAAENVAPGTPMIGGHPIMTSKENLEILRELKTISTEMTRE